MAHVFRYANIILTKWLIVRRRDGIKITYANSKVEKFFTDYAKMQKALPADWVRTIKKYTRLRYALRLK